jgi:enoyl-CoA hydratase
MYTSDGSPRVGFTSEKLLVERLPIPESDCEAMLLTFNVPERLNPMDWEVFNALEAAVLEGEADPQVRTIMITGAGRAFSAGGDLKDYIKLQRDPIEYPKFLADAHRTFLTIRTMGTPFISLVNGVTAAGGLELILFSDWAYAAESSRIGDMHVNFGMMGGGGDLSLLPRAIHPAKARELVLTGRLLPAQEAFDWGIVNKVVPDAELLDTGLATCSELANKSPLALKNAKHVMNGIYGSSVEAMLRYEYSMCCRYVLTADDPQEGLAAFAEKREPKYAGR